MLAPICYVKVAMMTKNKEKWLNKIQIIHAIKYDIIINNQVNVFLSFHLNVQQCNSLLHVSTPCFSFTHICYVMLTSLKYLITMAMKTEQNIIYTHLITLLFSVFSLLSGVFYSISFTRWSLCRVC